MTAAANSLVPLKAINTNYITIYNTDGSKVNTSAYSGKNIDSLSVVIVFNMGQANKITK